MAVTWDTLRQQFTDDDVAHMKQVTNGSLDLSNCQSVQQWASQIYQMVSSGEMPPGSPWSAAWVANFKDWMDAGSPCT
jgi:hypothetical protein